MHIVGIINNSAESLFSYGFGTSHDDFYDEDFMPVFDASFSDPELQTQAEDLCGDDTLCLFDIAATGRTDIGLTTLAASQVFEEIVELTIPG